MTCVYLCAVSDIGGHPRALEIFLQECVGELIKQPVASLGALEFAGLTDRVIAAINNKYEVASLQEAVVAAVIITAVLGDLVGLPTVAHSAHPEWTYRKLNERATWCWSPSAAASPSVCVCPSCGSWRTCAAWLACSTLCLPPSSRCASSWTPARHLVAGVGGLQLSVPRLPHQFDQAQARASASHHALGSRHRGGAVQGCARDGRHCGPPGAAPPAFVSAEAARVRCRDDFLATRNQSRTAASSFLGTAARRWYATWAAGLRTTSSSC